MELLTNTKIDFIGWRKVAFLVSAGLVLLGLVALAQTWRGAANLGIDFAGGTPRGVVPSRMESHPR